MKEDSIFINRELSWLDFNQRVLVLGKDKNVPLAEQLKFLAIYGSNLDEFFMVRVGSLQERANLKEKKSKPENKTNMTPEEQLNAIMPKTAALQADCDKYYHKALEALAEHGYRKVNFEKLSKEEDRFWKKYFLSELFPILSPQIVDQRHPFPFLRNKETYFIVQLSSKADGVYYGIIPINSQNESEGGSQKQVRIMTRPITNIKIPDRRWVRFHTSVLERVQGFLTPTKKMLLNLGIILPRKRNKTPTSS